MKTAEPSLEIGTKFLAFWVKRLIGRGGIGEVYEITNKGKREALKVIQAKWLGEESLKRRMVDEGELLVRVKHPNVVDVHETGITPDGVAWIRMELLEGETLREVMNRRGLISVALACTYMRSAGYAAHQCHVIGAVHRDIKPENLFITNPDEIVKLLDFGIAKLYGSPDTVDGQRHGTPLYMAPEQIRGHRVTPATDVYALGLVAYELLCGANPFVDDPRAYDLYALYYKHFSEVPAPLTDIGIPQEISDVVAKALVKDPKQRYPNGLAFAEALWGAWSIVREREPGWDTEPGEPTKEELMERAEDGLFSFGTGPSEGRPSALSDVRPSRVSRPSRISLAHRAVVEAKAQSLPNGPCEPEAIAAYLAERASGPAAPGAQTEQLPEGQRDPSCVAPRAAKGAPAVPSVRLAPVVALPARPRWVPVQTTVPLAAARAEAVAPARAELAVPLPVTDPPPPRSREHSRVTMLAAATQPYPPPPRPIAEDAGAASRTATVPTPPRPHGSVPEGAVDGEPDRETRVSGLQPRQGGWAEAPDIASAGIRLVPGTDVRVFNPRLAGTFVLPEPLAAAAHEAKGRRPGRPAFRLPHERIFVLLALVSAGLVILFLALHVARAPRRGAPEPSASPVRQDTAGPSTAEPAVSAPSSAAMPRASALPVMSSVPEPARTASAQVTPPAPPPHATAKPRPRAGEVVDPWAR